MGINRYCRGCSGFCRIVLLLTTATLSSAAQNVPSMTSTGPQAPYIFRNVAIVAGGFITGIVPHPTIKGLTYLRTDIGGAYRRDLGSDQWIPLTDWVSGQKSSLLGIEAIACDPTDPDRLYLAAGTYDREWSPNGAMLVSTDRGNSFETVELPLKMGGNEDGRSAGERLVVDPANPAVLYFGSRKNGLWKSTDHAHTWSHLPGLPAPTDNDFGVTFLAFDSARKDVLYAGVASGAANLYRSTDAGETWSPVAKSPAGLLPNHGIVAGKFLYVTFGDKPGPNGMTLGGIWKLNLEHGDWKDISPEKPDSAIPFGYGGLAVDPTHPETLVVSTMDRWRPGDDVFRSTDGGRHWKSLKEKAVRDDALSPYLASEDGTIGFGHWIGALALDPFDPDRMLYGTGATLWSTTDLLQANSNHATHWVVGAKGIEETAVVALLSPPSGPPLFSGLGDIGCFRHDDLRASPRGNAIGLPRYSNCDSIRLAAGKPNLMVRAGRVWHGNSHGSFSRDGGQTWTTFPNEPSTADHGGTVALSSDGSVLIWATGKGVLASSTDLGTTWKATDQAPPRGQLFADPLAATRFYLYDPEKGSLFASEGPEADFKPLSATLPKWCNFAIAPDHTGDLWLGCKEGLFRVDATAATPAGTQLAGVDTANAIGFGKPLADGYPTIFLHGKVGGVEGVFRSTDTGQTWLQVDDDRHHYGWIGVLTGDPRVFGRVYLGSNGRGIIQADPAP